MSIGDILVALDVVTPQDVAAGRELQRTRGGGLGDRLVELGRVSAEKLESVLAAAPVAPRSLAEVGPSIGSLLSLLVKMIYASSVETPSEIAEMLRLPGAIVLDLMEHAEQRQLVTVVGAVKADVTSERRYALTPGGLDWARAAMQRSEYVGPAPVTLDAFREQIGRQLITLERFDQSAIDKAFVDLVVSDELFTKLGPAINSGRSILLYGPPGNGKTTIAEAIGSMFKDLVYVPHCFEVDGQIIKVFDPLVHRPLPNAAARNAPSLVSDRESFDQRWEVCRRPVITVGGELTLNMLDLGFNTEAKFYEAPLHIKALGGVFLIDDFGRQLVQPRALLNRWIMPLEDRRDHLKLTSGKSFSLPFDELVLFATNLSPNDLMDAAFLRRIPYKIEVPPPPEEAYRAIFARAGDAAGLKVPDKVIDEVISEIGHWGGFPLAGYQPGFIVDQIRAASRFENVPPEFLPRFVAMALSNLHTTDMPDDRGATRTAPSHRTRAK